MKCSKCGEKIPKGDLKHPYFDSINLKEYEAFINQNPTEMYPVKLKCKCQKCYIIDKLTE